MQPGTNLSFRYPEPPSQFTSRDVRALQDPADHRTTSHDLIVAVTGAFTSTEVVYGVTDAGVTDMPEYGVSP